MRKTNFANDEYYHVYNRGTDKRKIFLDYKDYDRFIKSLDEFNSETPAWKFEFEVGPRIRLVEIIAYCLNPNHYHLILKQLKENGITEFMRKIGTGYTMYFNKKTKEMEYFFKASLRQFILIQMNICYICQLMSIRIILFMVIQKKIAGNIQVWIIILGKNKTISATPVLY